VHFNAFIFPLLGGPVYASENLRFPPTIPNDLLQSSIFNPGIKAALSPEWANKLLQLTREIYVGKMRKRKGKIECEMLPL